MALQEVHDERTPVESSEPSRELQLYGRFSSQWAQLVEATGMEANRAIAMYVLYTQRSEIWTLYKTGDWKPLVGAGILLAIIITRARWGDVTKFVRSVLPLRRSK